MLQIPPPFLRLRGNVPFIENLPFQYPAPVGAALNELLKKLSAPPKYHDRNGKIDGNINRLRRTARNDACGSGGL
jgi:hypothetical protein